MSRLIESIRLENGEYKNLAYHALRMKRAWQEVFKLDPPFNLVETLHRESPPAKGLYKCRLVYDTELRSIEYVPYHRRDVSSLMLVRDDTISYPHKFEDRTSLDDLFAHRTECDDVLIAKNGLITDTSYSNIAFRKGDTWVTPSSFLLPGTMRQKLIDDGMVREETIKVEDLPSFDKFKLVNAMLEWSGAEVSVSSIVGT